MWNWLRSIFSRRDERPALPAPDLDPPPWAGEMLALLREPEPPAWAVQVLEQMDQQGPPGQQGVPPWAVELHELVQKSSRVQGKVSLRLDELDRKLEGGIEDLRQTIRAATAEGAGPTRALRWDDLLDAMDLLEALADSLAREAPEVAEGLGGVLLRLGRFLGQGDLSRHAVKGHAPDGRLFRVVGTEERQGLPEGAVTRVVRAAVKHGDRLIREGEVLTNRRAS